MAGSDLVVAALQSCIPDRATIQFDDVYKHSLARQYFPGPGEKRIKIFVHLLSEEVLTIKVYPDSPVEALKVIIADKHGIPPAQQRLIFAGKQLEHERSLASYKILEDTTIHMINTMRGGGADADLMLPKLDPGFLDPKYDCDFSKAAGDAEKYKRGGVEYIRPIGWMRHAIKLDKYGPDFAWIGGVQLVDRKGEVEGEWAVSYHGTNRLAAQKIVITGYDPAMSMHQVYGRGIYSSPDPKIAEDYAEVFSFNGKRFKFILQNRVNLEESSKVTGEYRCNGITKSGPYYITRREEFIRPYGVCIKQI